MVAPAVSNPQDAPQAKAFVNITDQAGLRHRHHKPILDKKLDCIMPWMASVGAAAAAGDYDNDGDIDIYVTNSQLGKPNRLFRNNGDMTFTDVGAEAGVAGANDEFFLFTIRQARRPDATFDGQFQDDLDQGVFSAPLREELAKHSISLSEKAVVSVMAAGQSWRVTQVGQVYTIKKGNEGLNVLENRGTSMDAAWGDFDNDGHLDLYVVKWGWNILYRANGDGTFTDVTEQTGVGDPGNGNAVIWFDYNDDSHLDLYIGNYFRTVHLWSLEDARQMHEDFETARDAGANVLYRNNGDGTFTDVSAELGVDDTGWTLDTGAADYDNDGDQDLANANDFGQDRVYRVNADGTFSNVTDAAIGWDTHKGMNIEFGDYNNDGWLDLYVTNIWTKEYVKEGNQLYRNMGDGSFSDISFEANVYDGGWCWAGRFWDFDNDGDLDIMVANGYISGNPEDEYFTKLATEVTKPGFDPINAQNWPTMGDSTFSGYQTSRVWRNEGNEAFEQVAKELGLADIGDGRGLAIADYDNDGDLDVYIANQGQDSSFYRNDIGNKNNWLQIDVSGTNCNRDAIGTRITVTCGELTQIREINGGNGDHSQVPYRQYFGLGQHEKIDVLEIRWPTGYVERFENLEPNQLLKYTENTPAAFLEERKRFKEVQIEARKLEAEREKRAAEAAAANPGEAEPELDWSELQQFKKEYLRHKQAVENDPRNPQVRFEFALVLDKRGRRSAALSELEKAIRLDSNALLYTNTYRMTIRSYGHAYYDRSIRFFEDLVDKYPNAVMPRLNKALAYVDKMPYPKLGIVSQGKLSNKSLAELDIILAQIDAECWTAKFIRGMNHLHWPRKLGHAPLAIKDFTELIELQNELPPEKQRDYFAFGYVGLGDSYVKNREEGFEENLTKARQVWELGLKEYPDSEEMKKRLELYAQDKGELIEYVKGLRGLEDPVDTDLAKVWVD
ncbi:MAG: VCBS repeat-containing protein [Phycisphaerae bacterium]|nr:VCBS repeat-containing protein [Phycisphaerae bacterium]